jgi:hypothetical protein
LLYNEEQMRPHLCVFDDPHRGSPVVAAEIERCAEARVPLVLVGALPAQAWSAPGPGAPRSLRRRAEMDAALREAAELAQARGVELVVGLALGDPPESAARIQGAAIAAARVVVARRARVSERLRGRDQVVRTLVGRRAARVVRPWADQPNGPSASKRRNTA